MATKCPQVVRRPTGTVIAAYATRRKHAKLKMRRARPKIIGFRVPKRDGSNEFSTKP
jgi:hypothetical protein